METINSEVIETEGKHFICIVNQGDNIKIPLSEDKPNDVKSAFNKLLEWIKKGKFEIVLDNSGSDLFSEIAKEYISQLNREIQEVHAEMEDLGLLDE
ncbi:hypothetical protein [Roseiconus lacunae]|uniref:Uncharacterized protein n=1 Tax=Roseiconus lacunae TaxID=2605694 RepID=A0ABT7PQ95_9BACT|nr:hypothetical protein [Roseiconus lacunae]MDM4018620.1 hypothetical protein [Roseiconus lacunae]